MKRSALIASLALALFSAPAFAAEAAPLLSMKRVSFATGIDHRWQPERQVSWAAGLYGAYNLTPHASIVGSTLYDLKAERLEHRVGVRIRIFQGSKQ
jgi:hypothetical protein